MLKHKLKVKFTGKEIFDLILSILTIGFVFSFNNWGVDTFEPSVGIINFIRASILAAMALVTHIYIQKITAKKYQQEIEYKIWYVEKIPFSVFKADWPDLKIPFVKRIPLGILIPLFIAFISNGEWLFLSVASFTFLHLKPRMSKEFPLLTDYEEAKIAASGPLGNVFLAVILKLLSLTISLNQAIQMNLLIALYHLIPLPGLSGIKIWFGDRLYYVFILFLVIFISTLILVLSPIATLVISLISTVIITIFYFYIMEFKKIS